MPEKLNSTTTTSAEPSEADEDAARIQAMEEHQAYLLAKERLASKSEAELEAEAKAVARVRDEQKAESEAAKKAEPVSA